jgi:hypothetical protein
MGGLYHVLDAVRLLERAGVLDDRERSAIAESLRQYLTWLLTSPEGTRERQAGDHRGTCYDLQTAAVAAYLGEVPVLVSTFRTSRERLLEQFAPDGSQPQELAGALSADGCCFNLQSWADLATLAERAGDALRDFRASDGRSLRRAFEWLLPFMGEVNWPYRQEQPFDRERFLPLHLAGVERYGTLPGSNPAPAVDRHAAPPLFSPRDGIRPFWMLSWR